MRAWILLIVIGAAAAACDDSIEVNPVPHDAGPAADAAAADGGRSDAGADAGHD